MTRKEFIELVFEQAFGDDALRKGYTFEQAYNQIKFFIDTLNVYVEIYGERGLK